MMDRKRAFCVGWRFLLASLVATMKFTTASIEKEGSTRDVLISSLLKELAVTKQALHNVSTKLALADQKIANLTTRDSTNHCGKQQPDKPITKGFSGHKLVHLDLGGAPPKMWYLLKLLPFFRKWGATGLLVEYADTFPYSGDLQAIPHTSLGYTKQEIQRLLAEARNLKMVVIPLVQSFGHLEFVLKHKEFSHLRETTDFTNSLCPTNEDSISLVKTMIDQVLEMHSDAQYFHVGGDEVWNMETCSMCMGDKRNETMLFLHHMRPVLEYVKQKNVVPIMWDDMMRDWDENALKVVANLAEPMVWYYRTDLNSRFSKELWDRYTNVFPRLWIAGAFKGATEPSQDFVPIASHVTNTLQWLDVISSLPQSTYFQGFALTGWSRYDHYGTLCELLPAGLPSLAFCLETLDKGYMDGNLKKSVSQRLGFHTTVDITGDGTFSENNIYGDFPGHQIYRLIYKLKEAQDKLYHAHTTEKGWLLDRQIKSNFLSLFRLQSARWQLVSALSLLNQVKDKAVMLLPRIYDNATVVEWIQDKIIDNSEQAAKRKAAIEENEQRIKENVLHLSSDCTTERKKR